MIREQLLQTFFDSIVSKQIRPISCSVLLKNLVGPHQALPGGHDKVKFHELVSCETNSLIVRSATPTLILEASGYVPKCPLLNL